VAADKQNHGVNPSSETSRCPRVIPKGVILRTMVDLDSEDRPILNCALKLECPKTWTGLYRTDKDSVRHCQQCKRNVTLCMSQSELDALTAAGKCVVFRVSEVSMKLGLFEQWLDARSSKKGRFLAAVLWHR
jgi:hypothetical protein